jgi:hypothetical protein
MSTRTSQHRLGGIALVCVLVLLVAGLCAFAQPAAAAGATGLAAAATATPTGVKAAVKGATMNVRGGPGTTFPVIASAKKGQSFDVQGKTKDGAWLQLCCFSGKPGWASANLVTVTGDLKQVPVPAGLPTPPPAVKPAAKAGGKPAGVLLYSVLNRDADRWELWEYNFATAKSRFLKEWRTEVAFAPDYKQVVYYAWPEALGEKYGLYAANPDLSGERLIIPGGAYPSWAPSGSRLSAQGGNSMYVLNSDGSGLRKLEVGEYPDWSPVDDWIAHRGCYGPDCGLWITHADSGERRRLTTGGGDGQPAWSPDGKQIAYISKDDGNFEIYKINRDGSGKVRLTETPQSDGLPIWSPDGKWIAFRSDRSGKWAIYVMRSDGSGVAQVVEADVLPLWFWEKMAWRP